MRHCKAFTSVRVDVRNCVRLQRQSRKHKAIEEHVLLVLLKILTKPKAAAIGECKALAVCTHIPV